MKAVILAGGLGTRLRPLTEKIPKPLLPVQGKPIIEHAVLNLRKHGIEDIVFSIGYLANLIRAYFDDGRKWGVNIDYCIEEQPLGTGGAIRRAVDGWQDDFLVINGDNLADFNWSEMITAHFRRQARATLALFPVDDVTQYGIAELAGERIKRFVEKPNSEEAPSNLSNAGAYVLNAAVLDILPQGFSMIEKDCFEKICPYEAIFSFRHLGQWFPTDTLEKYERAVREFNPLIS